MEDMQYPVVSEEDLQILYTWIDEIPLSRPKKNIARDFSDGEIVKHFLPKLVELHNYSAANANTQKTYNWRTLNQKVFRRLNFQVPEDEILNIVNCRPQAIERVLIALKARGMQFENDAPSSFMAEDRMESSVKQQTPASPPPSKLPQPTSAVKPQQQQQAAPRQAPVARSQDRQMPEADSQILLDKEQQILELMETNEILEDKIRTLEHLVRLKDSKIQALEAKLRQQR